MKKDLKIFYASWIMVVLMAIGNISHAEEPSIKTDKVMIALTKELNRSFEKLENSEKEPMYFLGYEIHDTRSYNLSGQLGAIANENDYHYRSVTIDVRIGDKKLDNTHQVKGSMGMSRWSPEFAYICREDDEKALRSDIWLATDKAYKSARDQYMKIKTNKAMTADEEDQSDDFTTEPPSRYYEKVSMPEIDKTVWNKRIKKLSSTFNKYPFIIYSTLNLNVNVINRYIINSEGTKVVTGNPYISLSYSIVARTEDGMIMRRYKDYHGKSMADLPTDKEIISDMEQSADELEIILKAPLAEPYIGPAIFEARAAGVYFHEILGHRLEGHRQKLEKQGQTFAKKLDKKITADFLNIYDDATLERWKDGKFLRGFYKYDDEGIPVKRIKLVENGILKNFLMSRSPIKNFSKSNGHGRRSQGRGVVARMGNTIIEPSTTVPRAKLRKMLIEEIKKQGKPYGLIFVDISGGLTVTGRGSGQIFKVNPLLVYRVYADGRPDEAVRGVDIVGTPLTSFNRIIAAGDDFGIFNGTCGAESGSVPVSAISPSILFSEIEVEKKFKVSEKPPILPPPHHDKGELK